VHLGLLDLILYLVLKIHWIYVLDRLRYSHITIINSNGKHYSEVKVDSPINDKHVFQQEHNLYGCPLQTVEFFSHNFLYTVSIRKSDSATNEHNMMTLVYSTIT